MPRAVFTSFIRSSSFSCVNSCKRTIDAPKGFVERTTSSSPFPLTAR